MNKLSVCDPDSGLINLGKKFTGWMLLDIGQRMDFSGKVIVGLNRKPQHKITLYASKKKLIRSKVHQNPRQCN